MKHLDLSNHSSIHFYQIDLDSCIAIPNLLHIWFLHVDQIWRFLEQQSQPGFRSVTHWGIHPLCVLSPLLSTVFSEARWVPPRTPSLPSRPRACALFVLLCARPTTQQTASTGLLLGKYRPALQWGSLPALLCFRMDSFVFPVCGHICRWPWCTLPWLRGGGTSSNHLHSYTDLNSHLPQWHLARNSGYLIAGSELVQLADGLKNCGWDVNILLFPICINN